jgi:hypothetical protein
MHREPRVRLTEDRAITAIGAGALIRNAIKLQDIGALKPTYGTMAEEVVRDQLAAWEEKGYRLVAIGARKEAVG